VGCLAVRSINRSHPPGRARAPSGVPLRTSSRAVGRGSVGGAGGGGGAVRGLRDGWTGGRAGGEVVVRGEEAQSAQDPR
jgi:hypothetical protein